MICLTSCKQLYNSNNDISYSAIFSPDYFCRPILLHVSVSTRLTWFLTTASTITRTRRPMTWATVWRVRCRRCWVSWSQCCSVASRRQTAASPSLWTRSNCRTCKTRTRSRAGRCPASGWTACSASPSTRCAWRTRRWRWRWASRPSAARRPSRCRWCSSSRRWRWRPSGPGSPSLPAISSSTASLRWPSRRRPSSMTASRSRWRTPANWPRGTHSGTRMNSSSHAGGLVSAPSGQAHWRVFL